MDSMQGMRLPDVERWAPRVVVVRGLNPGPFTGPGTNTYLLGTGQQRILLDTGSGVEGYVDLLEGALFDECGGAELGDILITHTHPDHLGGVPDILRRFGEREVSKMPWPERDQRVAAEITEIGDGDVFQTDGVSLRAIHTPGHAQDHLCFYMEEERALFTGDVVLGAGTAVIPLDGGDMALYLDSLQRLLDLELERIYPGHGPFISKPKEKLREYIDHRAERERAIIDAVARGATTVEQMVEHIYTDTPRYLHPAAGQSVLSHLLKLQSERRAARTLDAGGEEHWAVA
jgi:glyoxylase-like metal-dependent hydrolase (beta-lactamase superfamily II)